MQRSSWSILVSICRTKVRCATLYAIVSTHSATGSPRPGTLEAFLDGCSSLRRLTLGLILETPATDLEGTLHPIRSAILGQMRRWNEVVHFLSNDAPRSLQQLDLEIRFVMPNYYWPPERISLDGPISEEPSEPELAVDVAIRTRFAGGSLPVVHVRPWDQTYTFNVRERADLRAILPGLFGVGLLEME